MDTNGYLVCNGGGLVFCSVVDVGGGERELWTSCTLTHAHTHTYTQICTQQHEQQLQLLHRLQQQQLHNYSNNDLQPRTLISPALFPDRDKSAINSHCTATTKKKRKNPSMRILLLFLLLSAFSATSSFHCICDFYYPHHDYLHRLLLILTHDAHGSHALTRRREWLIDRKRI